MAKLGVMLDSKTSPSWRSCDLVNVCVRRLLILSKSGSEIQVRVFVQYQVYI